MLIFTSWSKTVSFWRPRWSVINSPLVALYRILFSEQHGGNSWLRNGPAKSWLYLDVRTCETHRWRKTKETKTFLKTIPYSKIKAKNKENLVRFLHRGKPKIFNTYNSYNNFPSDKVIIIFIYIFGRFIVYAQYKTTVFNFCSWHLPNIFKSNLKSVTPCVSISRGKYEQMKLFEE